MFGKTISVFWGMGCAVLKLASLVTSKLDMELFWKQCLAVYWGIGNRRAILGGSSCLN